MIGRLTHPVPWKLREPEGRLLGEMTSTEPPAVVRVYTALEMDGRVVYDTYRRICRSTGESGFGVAFYRRAFYV